MTNDKPSNELICDKNQVKVIISEIMNRIGRMTYLEKS